MYHFDSPVHFVALSVGVDDLGLITIHDMVKINGLVYECMLTCSVL